MGYPPFHVGVLTRNHQNICPHLIQPTKTLVPSQLTSKSIAKEPENPPKKSPVEYSEKILEINGRLNHVFLLNIDIRDPDISVVPYLAFNRIFGFEYLQNMAEATGALAAVNAGFFFEYGLPSGLVVNSGEINDNDRKRYHKENSEFLIVTDEDREYFNENNIEISPVWKDYLVINLKILRGYAYWHLISYLQKRNPNTTNIPVKLFPPGQRQLTNARKFWDLYISSKNQIQCIYSDQSIVKNKYSIDHFLPWSFTAHDLLWNLVPTTKEVNSSKSDNLPAENYLNDFVTLQFDAFHTISNIISEHSKLLEDYSILFNKTLHEISVMEQDEFTSRMFDNIKPQLQIAKNMGFQ